MNIFKQAFIGLLAIFTASLCRAQYLTYDSAANMALMAIGKTGDAQLIKLAAQLVQAEEQVKQILALKEAIGSGTWQHMSVAQIGGLVAGAEGMKGFNVATMFSKNGYLDVFMGMSANDFSKAVANPASLVSSSLMRKITGDVGAELSKSGGPSTSELLFAERLATMGLDKGGNHNAEIVSGVTNLLSARAIGAIDANSKRSAVLSETIAESSKKAQTAKSVNEKVGAVNEISAIQAQVQLEGIRQNQQTGAALVAEANRTNEMLERDLANKKARSVLEAK